MNVKYSPLLLSDYVGPRVASGFWLQSGLIGASLVAGGVLQLVGGETKPMSALALAVAGGVMAVLSWRRARSVLEIGAASSAAPSRAPLPGRAAVAR